MKGCRCILLLGCRISSSVKAQEYRGERRRLRSKVVRHTRQEVRDFVCPKIAS